MDQERRDLGLRATGGRPVKVPSSEIDDALLRHQSIAGASEELGLSYSAVQKRQKGVRRLTRLSWFETDVADTLDALDERGVLALQRWVRANKGTLNGVR